MARFWQLSAAGAGLVSAVLIGSCNRSGGVEQMETRTLVTPKETPKADASSAQRFGATGPAMSMPVGASPVKFSWTTPEGWEELPAKQFRDINLRPAGDPKAECYVTSFSGGGLTENVNRWRKQMGMEPVDDAAVAALPKKQLMGANATFVELEGNFSGMSNDQDNPDFKLAGLILATPGTAVSVKMTGPKSIVDQELPKFDALCASIKVGGGDPHAGAMTAKAGPVAAGSELPAGHPPIDAQMPAAGAAGSTNLKWTTPTGWVQGPPRTMREVTFAPGPDSKTECYIAKLINRGGGMDANINRWADQMGLDPLSADALGALPKIKVLGKDCPLVELKGTYTDMASASHPDSTLLGTISEVGSDAYFIKMVGPAAEVESQKANFTAFCESLAL